MTKSTQSKLLTPGSVIAVRYPMYKHFAIVSDKNDDEDMPNLISLSYRNHGVKEESWNTVVGSHNFETSLIQGSDSTKVVLSRARSCIGRSIKHQLLTFNCEHFVRYAHGLTVESVQVKNTLRGAALGVASCIVLPNVTLSRIAIMTTVVAATSLRRSLDKI